MADTGEYDYDFFISRRGAQAGVAMEVMQTLVEDGVPADRIFVQDKDLPPGVAFLREIEKAIDRSRHFIAILCSTYSDSHYTGIHEAQTFLHNTDVGSRDRRLIVIKVEPLETPALLRNFVAVDLAGIDDPQARHDIIRDAAHGRAAMTPASTPIFQGVPERLHHFTGRNEQLADLRHDLLGARENTGGAVAVTQTLAGMGGVGKTMMAAEYAHRHRNAYAGVWWAPAETRAVLEASLAELAAKLDPRLAEEADQAAMAKRALELVQQRARLVPWLLIYDNAETPAAIEGFRPLGGAHLIVTTRFQAWPSARTDVGLFPREASIAFLQERGERTDENGADRLADALGDLPLALEHAAAYCLETAVTFDEYAAHLDAFLNLRPESSVGSSRRDGEQTVSGTFSLALARAADQSPHAERLMDLLSVFAAEPVPLDLFDEDLLPLPERAAAVGVLGRFGLLRQTEISDGGRALSVHRLVGRVAKRRAEDGDRLASTVSTATDLLANAFPNGAYNEPSHWPRCAELLPHVMALSGQWKVIEAKAEVVRLLYRTGGYLFGRATFPDAEPMFRKALSISEKMLNPEGREASICQSYLGMLLRVTGRYEEAEPLYREALAINEKTFGREDTEVATSLNNLAILLSETKRFEEAERLFREAIEIGEKTTGRESPNVATWLNNLGNLLRATRRFEEANPLFREALAISEKALGREHPTIAIRLNNLANLLKETGRREEAEPLFREALAISEKALGRDHPTVATRLNDLASLLERTSQYKEAELLYREALATYEARLGDKHRWVGVAAGNLAHLLDSTDRAAEAADLRTRYGLD